MVFEENMNEESDDSMMTDKQYFASMLKTRLDELARLQENTTDNAIIEYIKARKKELREKLDKLFDQ